MDYQYCLHKWSGFSLFPYRFVPPYLAQYINPSVKSIIFFFCTSYYFKFPFQKAISKSLFLWNGFPQCPSPTHVECITAIYTTNFWVCASVRALRISEPESVEKKLMSYFHNLLLYWFCFQRDETVKQTCQVWLLEAFSFPFTCILPIETLNHL